MDSNKEVTHIGIISEIGDRGIKVNIVVLTGCAGCQIKGSCNMAEQSDKKIFIECDPFQYKAGQRVMVKLKSSQGMNALFLGYVLPFIILISVLAITSVFIKNEGIVGIVSLLSLLPYFIILFLFRKRIKKKFNYVIIPLND